MGDQLEEKRGKTRLSYKLRTQKRSFGSLFSVFKIRKNQSLSIPKKYGSSSLALFYKIGNFIGKAREAILEGFYAVHIKVRYLHDKTYQKVGWYRKYSDKPYSSAIHKASLAAFVISLLLFTGLQYLSPYFNIFKPDKVQAATNSKTWTTNGDFAYNKSTLCGATTRTDTTTAISGTPYTDNSCATAATDSIVTLSPPDILYDTYSISAGGGAGSSFTMAKKNDGTLWGFGDGSFGQIGTGVDNYFINPTQSGSATTWKMVSTGSLHSVGIKNDGTLWAWGDNGNYQLGLGDQTRRSSATQIGSATTWKYVTSGEYFSLAVKNDGTLWAWGNNTYGQLGLGDTNQRTAPTQVGSGTTWKMLAADNSKSVYAIKTDGTLWSWGYNAGYQLGLGDTTNRTSPVQVGVATTWKFVSAGYDNHAVAVRTDGTLWSWGTGSGGQLGQGDTANRTTPTQVGVGTSWKYAAAGSAFTIALKSDGTLWSTGQNGNGQLGLGDTSQRTSFTQIGSATSWKFIKASYQHAVAVKTDGTLWTWGNNNTGQLGLGDVNIRTSPAQVSGNTWSGVTIAYPNSGTISGLKIDSGAGIKSKWNTVSWSSTTPANTTIKFRSRGSDVASPASMTGDASTGWTYWNNDVNGATYYTTTGTTIVTTQTRWIEFELTLTSTDGVSTPTINDFTVAYDSLENPVNTNITLKRSDGTTVLKDSSSNNLAAGSAGGWSNELSVKTTVTGLSCSGCGTFTNPYVDVEYEPVGTAFKSDGTANTGGGVATGAVDGGNASTATLSGLVPGSAYHLQMRTKDAQGRVSGWTSYGNNAESAADFTIEQTAPTITGLRMKSSTGDTNYAILGTQVLTASGIYNDAGGSSGTLRIQFSQDNINWGVYSGSGSTNTKTTDWTNYKTVTASSNSQDIASAWYLEGSDADNISVYVRIMDNAGNSRGGSHSVTIQPGSSDGEDSRISNSYPSSNYGSDTNIKLGPTPAPAEVTKALIKIPLSSIPTESTVSSATFSWYLYDFQKLSGGTSYDFNLYRATSSWNESTVAWTDQPTGSGTNTATTTINGSVLNAWKDFSSSQLTTDVQSMVSSPATNYGWYIYAPTLENSGYPRYWFYTSEYSNYTLAPKLAVTYTDSVSDTISLDTVAPTGNIKINNSTTTPTYVNTTPATLYLNPTENSSGMKDFALSNDGITWGTTTDSTGTVSDNNSGSCTSPRIWDATTSTCWKPWSTSYQSGQTGYANSWYLTKGASGGGSDGSRTVYIKFRDNALNVGGVTSPGANWIDGKATTVLAGKYVYSRDLVATDKYTNNNNITTPDLPWKTTNTACNTPQCQNLLETYGGWTSQQSLSYSNSIDYALSTNPPTYPARDACSVLGGRLPNLAELDSIYTYRVSYYGNNFQRTGYWAATEYSTTDAMGIDFYQQPRSSVYRNAKTTGYRVRCVRDTGILTISASTTLDTTKPALSVVHLTSFNSNSVYAKTGDTVTLTVTASDTNLPVTTPVVTIAGHNVTPTGTSPNFTATYQMASGDSNGNISFNISGFADQAGNTGDAVTATTDSSAVLFDKTNPIGSITVNEGNQTREATVHLTLSTSDTGGSNLAALEVHNEDTSSWTVTSINGSPSSYTNNGFIWDLSSGEGTKTIFVRYKDNAGNYSNTYTSNIYNDNTPPTNVNNLKVYENSSKSHDITAANDTNWYPYAGVYFEWDASSAGSGIKNYKYCISTSVTCTPTTLTGGATNATASLGSNLDGTYYFRAVAVSNVDLESSTPTTFQYNFDKSVPSAVTGFATATTDFPDTQIKLTWNAVPQNNGAPLANYKIERVEFQYYPGASANWNTEPGYASYTTTNLYFVDDANVVQQGQAKITPSVKYVFRISAKDQSNPDYGNFQSNYVYGLTRDVSAPEHPPVIGASHGAIACTALLCPSSDPSDGSSIAKGFTIKVTWTAGIDVGSGIVKYKIYRTTNEADDSSWKVVGVLFTPTGYEDTIWYDNDSHNDATFGSDKPSATARLNDSTMYYYRITAVDGATPGNESSLLPVPSDPNFESSTQNRTDAATPDVTAPTVPVSVVANAQGLDHTNERQLVSIQWGASTDYKARTQEVVSGTVTYHLYRATSPDGPWTDLIRTTTELSYADEGLEATTTYYYRVSAFDAIPNESQLSESTDMSQATTYSSEVPSVPSNINITSKKGNPNTVAEVGHVINISFTGSHSNAYQVTKYEVYRSQTNITGSCNPGEKTSDCWVRVNNASKISTVDITPTPDDRDKTHTVKDSSLNDASAYYYRVRAQDNTSVPGHPEQSNLYSGLSGIAPANLHAGWDITPDATAPENPAGLTVKDIHDDGTNFKRNIITWERINIPERNGNNDFLEYKIYRSDDGLTWYQMCSDGTSIKLLGACTSQNPNPLYKADKEEGLANNYFMDLIPNAEANQNYYYYVTAVDDSGTTFKYPSPNQNTIINNVSNESGPNPQQNQNQIVAVSINPAVTHTNILDVGAGLGDPCAPYNGKKVCILEVGVSSARISWTTDQLSDSVVEFKKHGTSDPYIGVIDRLPVLNHAVTIKPLEPRTQYDYKVTSRNSLKNDTTVFGSDLPTLVTSSFNIACQADRLESATVSARIFWTTNMPSNTNVVEYRLTNGDQNEAKAEASLNLDDPALNGKKNCTDTPALCNHSVILSPLRSASEYTFRIKATSLDGYNTDSGLLSFRTSNADTRQFTMTPSSSNVADRDITATTAQIVFQTAVPTYATVHYGTAKGGPYPNSATDGIFTTSHIIKLEGLTPGAAYYYYVEAKDINNLTYSSTETYFKAVLKPKISNMTVRDVTPYSVTVAWETNVETETLINWGKTASYGEKRGVPGYSKAHVLKLENLEDNQEYHYQILAKDELGNEVADSDKIIRTPLDTEGPKIMNVKIDTLPLGDNDAAASVIISWETNKPATAQVQYDEGILGGRYSKASLEDKSLNSSHTVIVKDLSVATTYHLRLVSKDKRSNTTVSNDYTFMTPNKEKSILQLILKSLEETFSWMGKLGNFFKGIGKKAAG